MCKTNSLLTVKCSHYRITVLLKVKLYTFHQKFFVIYQALSTLINI